MYIKILENLTPLDLNSSWTVVPLTRINISSLVTWITEIDFSEWPQQYHEGKFRPAMVTDPNWHGFGNKAAILVNEILEYFPGYTNGVLMLSVIMPGADIIPHSDEQADDWIARIHIPLLTNEKAFCIVNNEKHHLSTDLAYLFNVKNIHSSINNGNTSRIHFMFDIRRLK